jgi:rRNA maturation RNase YbeY
MPKNIPATRIHFHFLKAGFAFKDRGRLKHFLARLFRAETISLEQLDYVFCSDPYLLAINQTHLNHNYFTDTVSFSLAEPDQPVVGEIYISIDRVRDNARQYGCSLSEELHRVIFHGALHLCGYPDRTPRQKKRMTQRENELLSRYLTSV